MSLRFGRTSGTLFTRQGTPSGAGLPAKLEGRRTRVSGAKLNGAKAVTRESNRRFLLAVVVGIVATSLLMVPRQIRLLADDARRRLEGTGDAATRSHPLDPAIKVARDGLDHIRENLLDYSALLIKRERINGKLGKYQMMRVKVRQHVEEDGRLVQPFSVYLDFLSPKTVKGREVTWVEGQNNGRLVAHEAGFKNLLRVKLKPDNPLAMFGQRYPITEIGVENLVMKLIEKGERDRHRGECQVRFRENAKVDKRVCTLIEVVHPEPRPYFDFYRARIFIDDELQLPIRYAAWSWPTQPGGEPLLEEEYNYRNLKLNVGLTEDDFDPDNPNYDFP